MRSLDSMGLQTRIALYLVPYLIVAVNLLGFYFADTRFFPVVEDFEVSTSTLKDGKLMITGSMEKARVCDYLGLSVYGIPQSGPKVMLKYDFDEEKGKTRGPGLQTWGPWTVTIPVTPEIYFVEIMVSHRCLGPWTQTAKLVKHNIKGVK